MKIAIGSDHGGYVLKEKIKAYLAGDYEVVDVGCFSEDSVDYPTYAKIVSKAVLAKEVERGILICGTGIGISIAANRHKGIRCALTHDVESARFTRLHNDSNVLAMGGRIVDHQLALEITKTWLETEFEGGRHIRRIEAIEVE